MHYCPRCETKAYVIEVRKLANGDKRRRLACQNAYCGHRWTEHQCSTDPKPAKPKAKPKRRRRAPGDLDLSDEQLLMILQQQELNNSELSRMLGCSRELIRQVRAGLVYRDRLPHIRRGVEAPVQDLGRRCEQCNQWLGYCTMGFPDPLIEGTAFANECVTFTQRSESLSRASAGTSPAAAAR